MPTPHNEAKLGEIAKTVIMPGDPLRAKYIAEHFLENARLVNQVRGMYAYTGTYQGKEITIMASGMGMPSMGIYSYELYHFYEVESIIRIGSCGAYLPELKLFDIILSTGTYCEGNYAYTLNNDNCHFVQASNELNQMIQETATEKKLQIYRGETACLDVFDPYATDFDQYLKRVPKDLHLIAGEMEAFSLFYNAQLLHKQASCLMTVVDSKFIDTVATTQERETGLTRMIQLALDAALKNS